MSNLVTVFCIIGQITSMIFFVKSAYKTELSLSRAFSLSDSHLITHQLHFSLSIFDRRNWRQNYQKNFFFKKTSCASADNSIHLAKSWRFQESKLKYIFGFALQKQNNSFLEHFAALYFSTAKSNLIHSIILQPCFKNYLFVLRIPGTLVHINKL